MGTYAYVREAPHSARRPPRRSRAARRQRRPSLLATVAWYLLCSSPPPPTPPSKTATTLTLEDAAPSVIAFDFDEYFAHADIAAAENRRRGPRQHPRGPGRLPTTPST